MPYYCYACDGQPLYLSEVSDPDSPHFDKPCCPYCQSTQVQETDELIEEFIQPRNQQISAQDAYAIRERQNQQN